jgi:hypothetical protein
MVVWRASSSEVHRCAVASPRHRSLAAAALPAVTWAATTSGTEKPAGHDWTLDGIFVVALGIPLILTILTLVDIAVRHTSKHESAAPADELFDLLRIESISSDESTTELRQAADWVAAMVGGGTVVEGCNPLVDADPGLGRGCRPWWPWTL